MFAGTPLEPALSAKIRIYIPFRDKLQPRIDFREPGQTPRDLVNEQDHNGVEALKIGLLVDREIEVALRDGFERRRKQIEASGVDSLSLLAAIV